MRVLISFLFVFTVAMLPCAAQPTAVSYNAAESVYQQNFDGLPGSGTFSLSGKGPHAVSSTPINVTGLTGWQIWMQSGSGSNAVFAPSTGSATGHGVYSLGSSSSSERALGSLASSAGIYAWGIILTNNTGSILNQINISFTAEQWRKGGSGNKNFWKLKYKTGIISSIDQIDVTEITTLGFSSPINTTGSGTLNGNLPENQQGLSASAIQVNWKPGEQLLIRWDDADETGSDDIMAIDNFSFSAKYEAINLPSVQEIDPIANNPTNADTIQYQIHLSGNTSGLSASNFTLIGSGITNATITKIEGQGTAYTATIFTGSGAGYLRLGITNNNNLIPGLSNIPFYALDTQWIDKVKPIQSLFYGNTDTLLQANDTLKLYLQFNESVFLDTLKGNNYIPVTIGSRVKNIVYHQGNGTTLLEFIYVIASGESDKDGIRIASAFQSKSLAIADIAGNLATLSISSVPIQKIKIDGIIPEFSQAKDTSITICNVSNIVSLNTYLKVSNKEANERLYWKLEQAPTRYTIQQQIFDTSATGSTIQPTIFFVERNSNNNLLDSCVFSISDGTNISFKKIRFRLLAGYTWLGTINSSWTEPNNWCNATIPTDSSDVQILSTATNMPNIETNVSIKNITIDTGASLTITGSLAYAEKIYAAAESINAISGTIQIKGAASTTLNTVILKNKSVKKLLIDNPGGVTVTDSLLITGGLALYKGNLITNHKVYLTKEASIHPSAAGTGIVGKIIVETGLLQKPIGKYVVGTPFIHSIHPTQFQEKFKLQLASILQQSMIELNFTDSTAASLLHTVDIANQKIVQVASQFKALQDTISGIPHIGNKELIVGSLDSAGFSFIHNPYLHPIETRAIQAGTGIAKYYWIWNPTLGANGGFTCISANQGYTVAPYESFVAYSYSLTDRSILFREEAKQLDHLNNTIPNFEEPNNYHIRLNLLTSGVLQDQWVLSHRDAGRGSFDSLDAPKLFNPGISLFSNSTNAKALAVDCRKIENSISVPLNITNASAGNYQFVIGSSFLPSDNQLVLHDRFLNKYTNLKTDSSYAFSITTDSNSYKAGRFEIAANLPIGSLERLLNVVTIKTYPNPVLDELKIGVTASTTALLNCSIYNPAGVLMKSAPPIETNKTLITIPVSELSPGLYILVVTHRSTTKSIQFIKQ